MYTNMIIYRQNCFLRCGAQIKNTHIKSAELKTLHGSDFCPRFSSGWSCVTLHPQSLTKTALFVALVRLCESCLVKLKAWSSVLLSPKQTGRMFPESQTFILFSYLLTSCSFSTSFHTLPHKTVTFFHRPCNLFIASAEFWIRALMAQYPFIFYDGNLQYDWSKHCTVLAYITWQQTLNPDLRADWSEPLLSSCTYQNNAVQCSLELHRLVN